MRIAINPDGVIFNKYWTRETQGDYDTETFGSLVDGAKEGMKGLKAAGHYIIIHTVRVNPEVNKYRTVDELKQNVAAALKLQEIPFDEIWTGTGLPDADLFIGDDAYTFFDWETVELI